LPPPEKIPEIPASLQIVFIGKIHSIVDDQIVIDTSPCFPVQSALDLDSVLCLEDRTPLGKIFDVFGPISSPFYSVRTSLTPDTPLPEVGKSVYCVPQLSSYVF